MKIKMGNVQAVHGEMVQVAVVMILEDLEIVIALIMHVIVISYFAWRERYNCQQNYEGTRVTYFNANDGLLDYTNIIVLGLENPFLLPGLTKDYKVSGLARILISFQHYNSCLDLTVSYNYQGVQLYIAVYDWDNNQDELVDIVVIDYNQTINVHSRIESTSGTYVTINLNITALCVQNFEGSDCTQCIPGFTGANCDVNIDDCVGMNCNGNGVCVDGIGSFSCNCNPGFTGELCQTNIDNCEGVNCSGNGQCVEGVNSFTCECMTGYSGPLCDEGKIIMT